MAEEHDPREDRLPRWAQDRLSQLRHEVAVRDEQLRAGGMTPVDRIGHDRSTPVIISGRGLGYQTLAVQDELEADWYLGNPSGSTHGQNRVQARLVDEDTLEVRTSDGMLALTPWSSNVVRIRVQHR